LNVAHLQVRGAFFFRVSAVAFAIDRLLTEPHND
jgi:hypothetical protein